jgi:hypothetical protein
MERQQLHHRPEPDVGRDLRSSGDEQLLVRGQAEVRAVMLGEMEGAEAGLVREPDQLEAVLEELSGRRTGDPLDVVEDAERRRGQGCASFPSAGVRRTLRHRARGDYVRRTGRREGFSPRVAREMQPRGDRR